MASIQGWGRQTWNSGAWNTFAPVEATGNGLTSTVGSVSTITTNIFGVTGIQLTSSIGDAAQASEYAVTGNAVTSSLGTMPDPTIVDNQLLTGWNRGVGTTVPLGWNAASWNNGDFILTTSNGLSGAGLTSSLGEETPTGSASISVTGLSTTTSLGTAVATGIAVATATGNSITSTLGTETVTGSSTHTVTGVGTTASLGDETATGVPQSGWNRGANQVTSQLIGWNDNLWNILETSYSLTGVQGSTATGSPTINISVAPTITGVGLTASTNTPGTSVFVTGVSSTTSIGTFSISGDSQTTIVAASEPEMDISTGTATVEIGKTAFPPGNAITSSLGSLSVVGTSVVSPSGISLTSSLGTEVASADVNITVVGNSLTITGAPVTATAGAIVSVTGTSLTSSLGEESQETSYLLPGVSSTTSSGTVTITASSTLTLTGVSATSTTGTLQGTFWNQVDDSNSDISWTEVHQAA